MNKQLTLYTILIILCLAIACDYELVPDETAKACFSTNIYKCNNGNCTNYCYVDDCEVIFDATCSEPIGDIVSFRWDFDGDNIFSPNGVDIVTHTYEAAGTYQVKLQIRLSNGSTFDTIQNVIVNGSTIYFENETPEVSFKTDGSLLIGSDVFVMTNKNEETISVNWSIIKNFPQVEYPANSGIFIDAWDIGVCDETECYIGENSTSVVPSKTTYNWTFVPINQDEFSGLALMPGTGTVVFEAVDVNNSDNIANFTVTIKVGE